MKALAPLVVACAAIAVPAFAQSYDHDLEAQRRRAELQAWGARADAQAAEAERAQAEARWRLRSIEAARNQPRVPGQAYGNTDSGVLTERLELDAAERRADDAHMRRLQSELDSMDAWLNRSRAPRR